MRADCQLKTAVPVFRYGSFFVRICKLFVIWIKKEVTFGLQKLTVKDGKIRKVKDEKLKNYFIEGTK